MHARDLRGRRVLDRRQWSSRADPCAGRSRPRSRNGARREALGTRSREPLQGTAAVIVSPTRNHPARRAGARHPAARVCGMRAGDVHGTTGPDSRARRLSVRTASVQDYFKTNPGRKVGVCRFQPKAEMERSGRCEQQPSPNARETRPPDPNHEAGNKRRVFRFLRSVFERWARVGDRPLSRGLHHGVARLPRWPTGWAESLSRISLLDLSPSRVPGEDRVGPAGAVTTQCLKHQGRPRWFGPDPLRTATRG